MFVSSPPVKNEIPILIHGNSIRQITLYHHKKKFEYIYTTSNLYDATNHRNETSTLTDYRTPHLQLQEPLGAAISELPPLPSPPSSPDGPDNTESKFRAVQITPCPNNLTSSGTTRRCREGVRRNLYI